jgi:molybdenum transport protein
MNFSDDELWRYIQEDTPFYDLTTHIQEISGKKARLDIYTRDEILVSCSEEAARIAELLGCKVLSFLSSKQHAKKGDVLLSFEGDYNDIHKAWRSAQILLEYSCKIATYTHEMLTQIRTLNQKCELLTTRKTFPFAKKFCIKSVITGGALPHRLNLSETILFFNHHRAAYDNTENFYKEIKNFKIKVPEKKVAIETESYEDALNLMRYGADVLQTDKISIEELRKIIAARDANYPHIKILASGGIHKENAKEYASCNLDGIITSKIYSCGIANLGTKLYME